MNLQPLGKRLVLREYEKEEKTLSGIVIPSSAQEEPEYAEVVAIGDSLEEKKKYGDLKVGDKVIYSKYAGTKVELEGEDYIVIDVKDVLAKINE